MTEALSLCTVGDCARPVHALGLCGSHYQRHLRGRSLDAPMRSAVRGSVEDRFWASCVKQDGDCWGWLGYHNRDGYSGFTHTAANGKPGGFAHRYAYELLVGPIPDGLVIDHLCRNRGCVNPAHMEPVVVRENTLRGVNSTANNARKDHCVHGHPFDEENTNILPAGWRQCRTCNRDRQREQRRKVRAVDAWRATPAGRSAS